MTDAQLRALAKLDGAKRPTKLHPSVARVLERSEFVIEAEPKRWKITEAGSRFVRKRTLEERQAAIAEGLTREQSDYADQVSDWIKVHADLTFVGRRYARRVTIALLSGHSVLPSGNGWKKDDDRLVRDWVEIAIDAIREIRRAKREARELGGNLVASYSAGPSVKLRAEGRRRTAMTAATEESARNVIGLEDFRQRRLA